MKNRFTPQTVTAYNDGEQVVTDRKFRNLGYGYDANGRMVRASQANQPDSVGLRRAITLGQYTFENGKVAVEGNSVAYTLAMFGMEAGDDSYIANQIGIDRSGAKTNVNTIVVSNDCETVITAYSGLPRQFSQSNIPGSMFRNNGWSIMHRSQY